MSRYLPLFILLCACDTSPSAPLDPATGEPVLGSDDSDARFDPDERFLECKDPVDGLRGRTDCGELIYEDHCGICHGAFGTGSGVGADLTQAVPRHRDEELLALMALGVGDEMPAASVPSPGYAHVLAYLRREFGDYDPFLE